MTHRVDDRDRFRAKPQAEIDGAALYHGLAENEGDHVLAGVYRRMAAAEERHAEIWRTRLREAGVVALPTHPG